MSDNDTILVCFAVNDDNGQDTEKATAFDFGHDWLHLAGGYEIVCRKVDDQHLRVGRKVFGIISYGTWIGNMVWNGARMLRGEAERLAEHLRSTGKWQPESGVMSVWDAWHKGDPIYFVNDEEDEDVGS